MIVGQAGGEPPCRAGTGHREPDDRQDLVDGTSENFYEHNPKLNTPASRKRPLGPRARIDMTVGRWQSGRALYTHLTRVLYLEIQ